MADDLEPKRSGTLASAGDTAILDAKSGDNKAGFNTVFMKNTGAGTTFIESSPNFISDPANVEWFDVDGTNSQVTTAKGVISFQQRAEAFRIRSVTFTSVDWWLF